jgi:pSer/pThr/pTyr-binding forkhead associated (FHA) protein
MKVYLVVLSPGTSQGKFIPVMRFPFLIGRDPACQLRPGSRLVSSRHCILLVRDGRLFVEDLNSTNGTLVDGTPVRGEQALYGGEILTIGRLDFRVTIEQRISVSNPTPMPEVPAPTQTSEDEAASILLLLGRDEEPASGGVESGTEGTAEGSTVIDPARTEESSGDHNSEDHPLPSEGAEAKTDTAGAADAILLKYRRRPRKKGG